MSKGCSGLDFFSKVASHRFIFSSCVLNHKSYITIHRQKYNRFPKYLIPLNRNMFPLRVKYDEVTKTKDVALCYNIVCQWVEKSERSGM